MIYEPNEKFRQISKLLSAQEWVLLHTHTLLNPSRFELAVFREPKFERVANLLLPEVNTTNVWASYNNMTKALQLCTLYSQTQWMRDEATRNKTWDSYVDELAKGCALAEADFNMLWLLSYRWNGLQLANFDSEQTKTWLLEQVAAAKKAKDPHAEAKLLWEAHNRDYHDAYKAWSVTYCDGRTVHLGGRPAWEQGRTYKYDDRILRSLPLKHRDVFKYAHLVGVGAYSIMEVATTGLCQGFFDLKLVYQTQEAAVAAKDEVVKALKER